jgi:filamentous hemagglutinin family protein
MKKLIAQVGIYSFVASSHLFSNPTGAVVASGDVSIDYSDTHHLYVDSRSDRAIVAWDSFSIDHSESTYFHLPDSSSAILNKVSSSLPSTLAGLLESNGHVYLLNPNGILITKEGVINTASFLASTLDVNHELFLKGEDLLFAGTSQKSVINQGKITAWNGDVLLLGLIVRNENEINAPNGVAALGSGAEILLTPHAEHRIAIQMPVSDLVNGDVGVAQEGIITALQTELKASGNAYAFAIQNSGQIHATSFEKTAGRVYLVADKGLVSHTGTITAMSGDVQILGETVALTDGAIVDVSGEFGGGSLLIGGDYRGANPNINNAMYTFIEEGVSLFADALRSGNGGKLIVWGVKSNEFFGFASAQGGKYSGSGGFVEISGMHHLEYRGCTNTLAANGSVGMLLLDPTDIAIVTGGSGLNFGEPNCFSNTYCGGGTAMAALSIDPAAIVAALGTSSITIDASAGSGSGSGSITIANGFTTPANGNTLTLIALGNVSINDNVTYAGTGALEIYAGSFNTGTEVVTSSLGSITLALSTSLTTSSSGNLYLQAYSPNSDCIVLNGTVNTTGGGIVYMNALGEGNIQLENGSLLASSGSGGFNLSATGLVNFNGNINIEGASSFFIDSPSVGFVGANTVTFNTSGSVVIQPAVGGGSTAFGDGVNSYVINNEGTGTFTVGGETITVKDGCTLNWLSGTSTLQVSAEFITQQSSIMVFDVGAGGLSMTSGCDLAGVLNYHTSSPFSATSSEAALIIDTTAQLTFDGGGTVVFSGTNSDGIEFNEDSTIGSFVTISGGTALSITETTGSISMGTNGYLSCFSSSDLTVQTTSGTIFFDGTSQIVFQPSGSGYFLSITSTDGDIDIGSISYGADTGTCVITSTTGNVGQNSGSVLDWSNSAAGGLEFTGGAGVAIEGEIIYSTSNPLSMTVTVDGTILQTNTSLVVLNPGAGSLVLNGVNVSGSNAIDLGGVIDYFTLNDFDCNVSSGDVSFASTAQITMAGVSGNLNIGTSGAPLPGDFSSSGVIAYNSVVSGKSLSVTAVGQVNPGNITMTGGGIAVVTSTTSAIISDASAVIDIGSGNLTMSALLGDITMNGTATLGNGFFALNANQNMDINTAIVVTGNLELIATTSLGDINFNNTMTFLTGATGSLTATANENFYINDVIAFNSSGNCTLTSTEGSMMIFSPLSFDTAGELFIYSGGYLLCANTIANTGIGSLFFGAADAMRLEPVFVGAVGQISSGGGDITIGGIAGTTETLIVQGGASPAFIQSNGGDIVMTSTGDMMLFDNANVDSGSGSYNLNIGGSLHVLAAANANITGAGGVVEVGNNLFIIADSSGLAEIAAVGSLSITAENVYLTGYSVFPLENVAEISSINGPLTVTAAYDLSLQNARIAVTTGVGALSVNATLGNVILDNAASVQHSGTGILSCAAGRDVVINGGQSGASFFRANGAGVNLSSAGALIIQSLSSNNGYIQAAGASSISANKIVMAGFSSTIPAFIQNSTGNLTVSGGSISMFDCAQIKLTGGSGTLAVNTTAGDLRIANNSLIQNSGTGATTSSVNNDLYINGGIGGASSFLGGNGGLSITVTDDIQMNGFSSSFDAVVSTIQGGLTISSGGTTALNLHTNITISGTGSAGTLQLTAGNNLLVGSDALIRNFGTQATTIQVTGVVDVLAGSGNATIRGGLGTMTLTATDDINVLSFLTGVASIQNLGNLSISTPQNIAIIGSPNGIQDAFIQTGSTIANPTLLVSAGNVVIQDGGNIALTAGSGTFSLTCTQLSIENNAFLQQQGSGALVSTIGGTCVLRGGPAGPATITTFSPLTMMLEGDLKIEADANSLASISSQGSTSISADRIYMIGFSEAFNAGIINASGNLSVSATEVNLIDFGQIQLTGGTGTMSVNATSGDLRITNGSFIQNQGTGQLSSSVGNTFYIEGGFENSASYISGSGGINVSANALMMSGSSSGNNALISAANGSVTLLTTMTMNLNLFATISVTGTASSGQLNLTVGSDLLVANGSAIVNAGTGATTLGVTGAATFIGGVANAFLQGNTGALSLSVGDNLHIISDVLGMASVVNTGNMSIIVGSDVHVIGSPEANLSSVIKSLAGSLSITAGNNIIVENEGLIAIATGSGGLSLTTTSGDLFVENNASIQQQGSGGVTVNIGASALIKSGASGNGFISGNSTLNFSANGDLLIEDVQGFQAYIASNGVTSISANRLVMLGFDAMHQGYIQNASGNLTVAATSIRMFDFAKIGISSSSGTLAVHATSGELRLANGSFIQNLGTGSSTVSANKTLYVEGGFSGASSIQGGSGGLNVTAESILMSGYSATNNAVISAANGALNVTTTGSAPLGMLNMTPNSKVILNAGSGNVTVVVGGNFYKSGGPTISTSGTGVVHTTVTGTSCSCP